MKTYKIQTRKSANGIKCSFYMNVDGIKTARHFIECDYRNNYEYHLAILYFETELLENGYVEEGDTIDYE